MYIVLMVDTSNCSSNLRHATAQMTSNLTYRLIRAKFTHAYNVLKGAGGGGANVTFGYSSKDGEARSINL